MTTTASLTAPQLRALELVRQARCWMWLSGSWNRSGVRGDVLERLRADGLIRLRPPRKNAAWCDAEITELGRAALRDAA